jgi:UDP:flavonoid glycosyltransferase YjiC (YdhE family)
MSRILIAWELGGNYGHLARCLPIAEGLRKRGHHVAFVVRDTRTAAELIGPAGFPYVQAPLVRQRTRLAKPPANYAEILLGEGYADVMGLLGMVQAWCGLLAMHNSEVLLADHAPTALLAARISGIPHLTIGNGFAIPPDVSPLPSIRPWEQISDARLAHAGKTVDAAIREVSVKLGYCGISGLRELFGPHDLLDTFAELDHYGERPGARYIGPIFSLADAQRVVWQEATGKKIVAYLRPDVPGFSALMAALRDLDAEVLCVVPGLRPEQARRLAGRRLRIALKPVALGVLLDRADIAISYGGGGMMSYSLLSGVPLLLVPQYIEQYLAVKRVEVLHAGVVVGDGRSKEAFVDALVLLLGDDRYAACARQFAEKYADFTPQAAVECAVAVIEACASNKKNERPAALNG